MKSIFSIFLFLLFSISAISQHISIEGTVEDTVTHEKLKNTVIVAARLQDSLLVSYTRSNTDGFFKLENLPVDTLKQNAVVEDLLKKLPGVKVDKQGKIFVEGKAVDQVLVDGDNQA